MNIAGSVAVITGGARGIGLAVARSLAAGGAKVVLGDVLEEGLLQSVRHIRAEGGEAIGVKADVTRDEDVEQLMDAAIARFGAINVVCANAGIIRDGLMLNPDPETGKIKRVMTSEEFRAVVEVNLVGAFITLREAARRMADNGWKGVLLVTSSIHKTGQPGQINYSSTKAAVALWPKILTGELHMCGIRNIRVVGIAPGYTATEGLKSLSPTTLDSILKDVHLGRLVEPEEIASTIKHVIENEAIDGTTIEVTGGVTYGAWQRAK
ncbi:MAG TPA: SDR family NAD(P)-dependent oxidoreductase [Thermoanaerobaculia bacterium]|nr:SDR family NAD(P)-dependent oxidoreductase [Thermoanaerobaculia bacterium]